MNPPSHEIQEPRIWGTAAIRQARRNNYTIYTWCFLIEQIPPHGHNIPHGEVHIKQVKHGN